MGHTLCLIDEIGLDYKKRKLKRIEYYTRWQDLLLGNRDPLARCVKRLAPLMEKLLLLLASGGRRVKELGSLIH